MLILIGDSLFDAEPHEISEAEITVGLDAPNSTVYLEIDGERIQSGVTWYIRAGEGKIGPVSGKITTKSHGNLQIRAIFGSNHIDFDFAI